MRKSSFFIIIACLLMAGCVRVPTRPKPEAALPPAPPIKPPALEKTFGEIRYGGADMLTIRYKDINIMVDPLFKDPLPSPDGLPPADYLFLTDLEPHRFGNPREPILRKNMKIICPPDSVRELNARGFLNARDLNPGQRLLLKKNGSFLFVSAVQTADPATGRKVNGYFLEFDNGRNIFLSGETAGAPPLRPFLYDLRDDGKEIHLAFLCAGGRTSEQGLAEMVSLLQPRIACLTQTEHPSATPFDEKKFRDALKEQIFSGDVLIPKPGDKISF